MGVVRPPPMLAARSSGEVRPLMPPARDSASSSIEGVRVGALRGAGSGLGLRERGGGFCQLPGPTLRFISTKATLEDCREMVVIPRKTWSYGNLGKRPGSASAGATQQCYSWAHAALRGSSLATARIAL